jgi:NitT/TauT family transport system ATP-binding protein
VRLGDRVVVLTSRPGTVAETFEVRLARPRSHGDPEVARLTARITDQLRAEVRRHASD